MNFTQNKNIVEIIVLITQTAVSMTFKKYSNQSKYGTDAKLEELDEIH